MFTALLTFLFGVIATFAAVAVCLFVMLSVKRRPGDVAALRAASLRQKMHRTTSEGAPRKEAASFRDWIDVDEEAEVRRGLLGSSPKFDSARWIQSVLQHAANLTLARGGAEAINASVGNLASRQVQAAGIGVHGSRWFDQPHDGTEGGSAREGLGSAGSVSGVGGGGEKRFLDGLVSRIQMGNCSFLLPTSPLTSYGEGALSDSVSAVSPLALDPSATSPQRSSRDRGASSQPSADDSAAVLDDSMAVESAVHWSIPQLDSEIRTRYVVERAAFTDGHGVIARPLLEIELGVGWDARVDLDVSGDVNPLASLLAAAQRRQSSPSPSGTPFDHNAKSSSRPVSSASSAVGDSANRRASMFQSVSNLSLQHSLAPSMQMRSPATGTSMLRRPAASEVLTTPHMKTFGVRSAAHPNASSVGSGLFAVGSNHSTSPLVQPQHATPLNAVQRIPRNLLSLHFQLSVTHIAVKADVKLVFFADRIECVVAPKPLVHWESVLIVGDSRAQVDVSYLSRIVQAAVGRATQAFTSPNAFVLRKPSPPTAAVPGLSAMPSADAAPHHHHAHPHHRGGLHFHHHSLRTHSHGRTAPVGMNLRATSIERAAAEAAVASATTSTRWRLERRLATPVDELDDWLRKQLNCTPPASAAGLHPTAGGVSK